MQPEVTVPEVYEVFKEIYVALEKLFDLRRWISGAGWRMPHRRHGMGIDHSSGAQAL
jgi:hypothetical protein